MKRNTVTALAFQSNPLFAQVRPGEIDCITVSYKHGEPVEDRIGETPCVGLVATGSVDVFSSSPNGGKLAVSTLRAGDAFGICNIYSDQRMPTMLVCRTAAKIVFITKEQFSSLLASKPEMLFSYLALCNNKMVFLATKIELAAISTCRGKILFYLQQNLGSDGRTVSFVSKEQLARLLGVSRASLFRELAAMQTQGMISIENNEITVLQPGIFKKKGDRS